MARLGADAIACVLTTTSCFAPRAADDVVAGALAASCIECVWVEGPRALLLTHPLGLPTAAVAKLCQWAGIAHVINNAYGVQSAALCAQVRLLPALQALELPATFPSSSCRRRQPQPTLLSCCLCRR